MREGVTVSMRVFQSESVMKHIPYSVVVAVMASLVAPVWLRSEPTRLLDAVRADDVRAVRASLKSGAHVNQRDATGATALMYAGAFGSLETVRALLDAKADVNLGSAEGATALIWAASNTAKVRLLLDRGAAIDTKATDGTTALVSAAQQGNADAVALLLSRGANPRASGDEGALLMQAGFVSMNSQVRQLLSAAGVAPSKVEHIAPAMMSRIDAMNFEVVTRFLDAGGPPNFKLPHVTVELPLLGYVAAVTDLQTVRLLLDRGADPNATETTHGSTPLMMAAAAYRPDPALVRLLIDRGAQVGARDDAGRSALDWALTQGETGIVTLLRAAGAESTAPPAPAPTPAAAPLAVRPSVEKALGRMDTIGPAFYNRTKCISCHNQSLPAMARTLASAHGVVVSSAVAAHPDEATLSVWTAQREAFMMGRCSGSGFIGGASYGLMSMAEEHTPRTLTTDTVAACLATPPESRRELGRHGRAAPVEWQRDDVDGADGARS
jgi:ankyrin repeat protein